MAVVVLYDGACGLCTRSVSWLRRLDWMARLRFRDINREWRVLSVQYPSLDATACAAALHVIDATGRVTAGFDGFRTIAREIPVLWPVWPILYVPGVPTVGRRGYTWVARHRRTTCALPAVQGPAASGPAPGP